MIKEPSARCRPLPWPPKLNANTPCISRSTITKGHLLLSSDNRCPFQNKNVTESYFAASEEHMAIRQDRQSPSPSCLPWIFYCRCEGASCSPTSANQERDPARR